MRTISVKYKKYWQHILFYILKNLIAGLPLSTPALVYREQKAASLLLLAPIVEDVLSAPASQAYVESIF